jgi:hypothetical protein
MASGVAARDFSNAEGAEVTEISASKFLNGTGGLRLCVAFQKRPPQTAAATTAKTRWPPECGRYEERPLDKPAATKATPSKKAKHKQETKGTKG